ncbi:hypothetical protein ABW19_dt0209473 [Dactylella cylindrospora]|nr:hypothetical protein ABW19_dt0209473 [Dactylella cylindrospora]
MMNEIGGVVANPAPPPLLMIPQEILTHIAKFLPEAFDAFALRSTCRALRHRLGAENQTLWFYFLKRAGHKDFDGVDPFLRVLDIVCGRSKECQVCLREPRLGPGWMHEKPECFPIYRGFIFYRSMCNQCHYDCTQEHVDIVGEYPHVRIHPNILTWHFQPAIRRVYSQYALGRDARQALEEQKRPEWGNSKCQRNLHYVYDQQISYAQNCKEASSVIVPLLADEYAAAWNEFHVLQPVEGFVRFCYDEISNDAEDSRLDMFIRYRINEPFEVRRVPDLIKEYVDSSELGPELRLKNIKMAISNFLRDSLSPQLEAAGSPDETVYIPDMFHRWLESYYTSWLNDQADYNTAWNHLYGKKRRRLCPFCGEISLEFVRAGRSYDCCIMLGFHIWNKHRERFSRVEEWVWVDVPTELWMDVKDKYTNHVDDSDYDSDD